MKVTTALALLDATSVATLRSQFVTMVFIDGNIPLTDEGQHHLLNSSKGIISNVASDMFAAVIIRHASRGR